MLRRFIQGTGDGIDLDKANKIVFITRRNDVVPVCARLTSEQAAAYFMLGESIETSAGDPTKAGQAKREVGTNPFIVGPEAEEGNRLLQILRENPDMQAYILNTGSIGAKAGSAGEKITIKISTEIMKQIAKEGIRWEQGPGLGLRDPGEVPGVDLAKYDPRRHYSPEEYARARRQAARTSDGSGWRSFRGWTGRSRRPSRSSCRLSAFRFPGRLVLAHGRSLTADSYSPKYASFTLGFAATSADVPSSATSPVSST